MELFICKRLVLVILERSLELRVLCCSANKSTSYFPWILPQFFTKLATRVFCTYLLKSAQVWYIFEEFFIRKRRRRRNGMTTSNNMDLS